jgi:putative intracellular protease/amidase
MQDAETGEILRHFHDKAKPTALLCHGPISAIAAMPHAREFRAALIAGDAVKAAEWAKGWQYAGYKMTVFSATEENVVEDNILHAKIYFNMPFALKTAGADVTTTAVDFEPYVVEDRELITGQNPRSDHPIAAKFIAALDRKRARRTGSWRAHRSHQEPYAGFEGRRIRSDAFHRSHGALFDDVVSPSQQRHGHIDAECFGGLEVDHQLDLGDLLHR